VREAPAGAQQLWSSSGTAGRRTAECTPLPARARGEDDTRAFGTKGGLRASARRRRAIRIGSGGGSRRLGVHELGRPHDRRPPYELHPLDHRWAWRNGTWRVARYFRREASTHARDDLVECLRVCLRRRGRGSRWRRGRRFRRGLRRCRLRARFPCLAGATPPRLRRNGRRLRRENVASHRDEAKQQSERPER